MRLTGEAKGEGSDSRYKAGDGRPGATKRAPQKGLLSNALGCLCYVGRRQAGLGATFGKPLSTPIPGLCCLPAVVRSFAKASLESRAPHRRRQPAAVCCGLRVLLQYCRGHAELAFPLESPLSCHHFVTTRAQRKNVAAPVQIFSSICSGDMYGRCRQWCPAALPASARHRGCQGRSRRQRRCRFG